MLLTYSRLYIMAIVVLFSEVEAFEFPSDFELCHRNDEACIVRRANEVIKEHPHGYPEISLQDFEPFRIKKLEISNSQNGPISLNLQMTDLTITGYSNMTFSKISGFDKEPSKIKVETESFNERVIMEGKYKISGRLLLFPITGEGNCKITIKGLTIKTRMRPTFTVKNGKTHLKTSNYKLQVNAENMKIHLTNLFNGERILSENILRIMNDNWKLIWDEMMPRFNKEIAAGNVEIFDAMFAQIPYEDMFLPD